MNKDRIAELLKEPALVAREDLAGLRELKQRYPWFSGAHLLLAMGEHATGEVLFDDTLHTTAAHLPSRELLWEEVEGSHDGVDVPAPVAAPSQAVRPKQVEGLRATPRIEAPAEDPIAQHLLDRQIRDAAAASAYDLASVSELPVIETPAPETAAPAPPRSILAPSLDEATADGTSEPEDTDLTPRSFTAWLERGPSAVEPVLPFVNDAVRSTSAQDWLRGSEQQPSTTSKPAPTPELTRDLIDRYLKQSTPEPKKTEFFTPQQAAKRSIEEHPDMITETLARILEKQGHWAKAAEAYQRLAQKHPQKSGYFAALAEKALRNLNT